MRRHGIGWLAMALVGMVLVVGGCNDDGGGTAGPVSKEESVPTNGAEQNPAGDNPATPPTR
jgi:hypothetical protein